MIELILDGAPHLPIAGAAERLQTTPLRILMLIKQEVLAGRQVDGEWFVDSAAVDFLNQQGITGPPPTRSGCNPGGCGCAHQAACTSGEDLP